MAQKYLGANIDSAIFSVPNYFTDLQSESIQKIEKMTPFQISEIRSSSAMALNGYLDSDLINITIKSDKILLFDLGWTSLDINLYKNFGIHEYLFNIINIKFK